MLVVSLCKPVIHKFKILGGGNLNIINQWEELQKGGGPNFDILVGEAKKKGGGEGVVSAIFDSNLMWGSWRKLRN